MPAEMKRSVCPDACGLLVEVEDDRAIKVSGDPEPPTPVTSSAGK